MGRTISSFRISTAIEKNNWRSFRKLLDKIDRKSFDEMFNLSYLHNSGSSNCVRPVVIHPIFLSILLEHYKQLALLEKMKNLS